MNLILELLMLLSMIFMAASMVKYFIPVCKAPSKSKKPELPVLTTGYSLFREDVYLSISIDSLIHERVMPSNLNPNDVTIWKHYTNGKTEKVHDLEEYYSYRPLSPEENEEIDAAVEAKRKEVKSSNSITPAHGQICSGIAMRLFAATGEYNPFEDVFETEKKRMIKDKARVWHHSFTRAVAQKADFSVDCRISNRMIEA